MANPIVFWFISGFLFLWGLAYLGLVIFTVFIATPEHWANLVAEGRIKPEYAIYISRIPSWVLAITVIAALTRIGGAVALLLQNNSALLLFGASLVFVAIIMFRGFVLADVASVIRPSQVILEIGFMALSVFAVWFAYTSANNGTLS